MADELQGKKIAILCAGGVEQVELTDPREALTRAGATCELVSLEAGNVQAYNHLEKGDTFPVERVVSEAEARDYDGLVLPGGVANPDFLRTNGDAVRFTHEFFERGKPVAAICHGPWTLVEANVVRGRTLTSYPSLRTDIENAGGRWVNEEVVVDDGLVTSRRPTDLPAFNAKAIQEFAEGAHEGQRRSAGVAA